MDETKIKENKMNAIEINIQPTEVSRFGQEIKTANKLIVTSANVRMIDNGLDFTFHMTDADGNVVYNDGRGSLTNEELATWTTTDTQLVDCILAILQLVKV